MNVEKIKDHLHKIQGKTIAVVYIFEGETAAGYEHYDIWKSDVVSEWINAIQENNCRPLILDARTFIEKTMSKTMPKIDAVINLNNGCKNLSTLSLIPSVCSFENIPCIPCNATSIIAGENKLFSNCIAKSMGLNIPGKINENETGIFRTLNYGSSRGTFKTSQIENEDIGFCQEFINGYDITTPLLFNPVTEELEVLPSVMYYSNDKDVAWFFNEEVKEKRYGYSKKILYLDSDTEHLYKKLAKTLQIRTYCRIDARIQCECSNKWYSLFEHPVSQDLIKFIEINPMPTLKQNINLHNSLDAITQSSKMCDTYNLYKSYRENSYTQTGFILFCSLLANL